MKELEVNRAYECFLDIFIRNLNESCLVSAKDNNKHLSYSKPWLNNTLRNACKKKNLLYKQYLVKKTEESLSKYKLYKNKLITILRSVEKDYYAQQLARYKGDIKSTWNVINSIICKQRKDQPKVSGFNLNGKIIKDNKSIANEFNNYFINIGPNLANNITPPHNRHFSDYMEKKVNKSIFLKPVTDNEILGLVNSFKNKYSCGYDGLNMYLIKQCIRQIKPLTYICNLSLSSGIFPDKMKTGKILPIYKCNDPSNFSNYRPISLLPQFSKLLEKLYNKRLMQFLNVNNVIYNSQYGFRQNHSTELAVLEMVEKISDALDKKMFSVGLFIDLKKAFDTLNHNILIEKLKFYGIRGVASDWLISYLSNRKQFVNFNNVNSDYQTIKCGIPQGSIIGPILFILYINDMCNACKLFKFIIFADDTNIFIEHKNLQTLEKILNDELHKLSIWFKLNKLSLNISKTKYILFGSKKINCDIVIQIDHERIERVNNIKFLGTYIDSKLCWNTHISHIEGKISRWIGIISRIKYKINEDIKLMLYNTLILPHFNYCCLIWGNNYPSRINNLIVMQKRIFRIIANTSYREHTAPLFYRYCQLKLIDLIKFSTNKIMYKAFNNLLPCNIQSLFVNVSQIHSHGTRQQLQMYNKSSRTNVKCMSVSVIGVKMWNALDNEIKLCDNFSKYKYQLKQFYVNKYTTV